jgi:hypothetical protein
VRPSKVRRRLLIHSSYTTPRDTNIRIFNDLRGPVYEGRYDAVRRYAWTWQRDRTMSVDAYIPSGLAAGEAYQFDGSHHILYGCVTAACCLCERIRARRRRWCSTLAIGHSSCARVPLYVASATPEDRG